MSLISSAPKRSGTRVAAWKGDPRARRRERTPVSVSRAELRHFGESGQK